MFLKESRHHHLKNYCNTGKKTLLLIIYLWFSHAFLCWNLSRKSSSVEIPVLKGIFSESPIQALKHPLSLSKPIIRANSLVSKTSRMGQNWEGNVRHIQILSPPIPVNAPPHKQRAVPALAGLWHFTSVPTVNVQVKHNHSLVGLFPHFLPCPLCSIFSPGTNTVSRSGVGDDPALSSALRLSWVTCTGPSWAALLSGFSFRGGLNYYQPELLFSFLSCC